jgi:hypothetical protein
VPSRCVGKWMYHHHHHWHDSPLWALAFLRISEQFNFYNVTSASRPSGCIDPHILDFGTSWTWVVSFPSWPLNPNGKKPHYPLERGGGPLAGLKLWTLGCPNHSQSLYWRMVSSGMLHHVALVRTDVSEEPSASFIRVTRIGELGTTLATRTHRASVASCS